METREEKNPEPLVDNVELLTSLWLPASRLLVYETNKPASF